MKLKEALHLESDIIILSQSCDLEIRKSKMRPNLRNVIISPILYYNEAIKNQKITLGTDFKEAMRRGYIPHCFLLKEINFPSIKKELGIVSFREVALVRFEDLMDVVSKDQERIRMKSPYREALSQAFGNFIMRVGKPEEIPEYSKRLKVTKFNVDD